MDCIRGKEGFIKWEEASRIASMPLLSSKMGYKTDPPGCLQWFHGSYVIKGECDREDKLLITDQPAPPTKECYFNLPRVPDPKWLVMLAIHESVITEEGESTVWVNSSLYSTVGDFKVLSKPFPGSICSENGTCYGVPSIPPLTAGSSKSGYSSENKVTIKPTRITPLEQDKPRSMGGKGYVRIETDEWEGFIDSSGSTGLFYVRNSSILNFKVNLYRPQTVFLHPYSFVQGRLEEDKSIISPVASLLGPDGRIFTIASFSPVKVLLRNGMVSVEPLQSKSPVMITEDPLLSGLKKLYNTVSPVVELDGYSSRKNRTPIGSIRIGCGLIDQIEFNGNELMVTLYNPGENSCIAELKFTGVIPEAYQDNNQVEPLYDRVRISLASHYLGVVKVKIKPSLSFLLRTGLHDE
ncbi:MAG: hypothetical protein F7B59_06570 [Desulfurococcales archaeon]|nr:hypothetical protein [Desulfurococcales archaeon]